MMKVLHNALAIHLTQLLLLPLLLPLLLSLLLLLLLLLLLPQAWTPACPS
jgi:hypothetical protein